MIVIFDLEGVLTDTDRCRFGSWKQMAKEQGLTYDEEMDAQLRALEAEKALEQILTRSHRSYSAAEQLALLTRRADLYDEILESTGDDAILPGALQLMQTLHIRRIRTGAAAENDLPGRVLSHTSLKNMFDVVSRKEGLWVQLLDIQEKLKAPAADCLLVTAHAQSAESARALGMEALICSKGETVDWQRLSDAMTVGAVK